MLAKLFARLIFTTVAGLCLSSCNSPAKQSIGSFQKVDNGFDSIVSADASIEVIADSLDWSEGPLWIESQQMLLFSDIPVNTVYKWTPKGGKQVYLKPSGYTSTLQRGGEIGSNGLALSKDGQLVLCQHGDRRIAVMRAPLDKPAPDFQTLADNYKGKKFDSPNDLVYDNKGSLYFTDPPYGLEKLVEDTNKQAPYQGVYRLTNGEVHLLVDSITRPNGIAFTPDFKTLIVANSDENKPYWYAFDISETDSLINPRIFYNIATSPFPEKGGGDGFKIDKKGNVYASGPGGIWIFNSKAVLLGRILIPEAVSNCVLADDEKTLYVTADRYVLKIRLR
ncbi:MAG TPA: SMP-30/gluconolactonase/LRE family protein [Flavitalea sp.]|nr:SMP-30/gluconolactonase/LRE family protein [Flavitalea sp.]